MTTTDWIGTAGVGMILLAYFFSTFGWLRSTTRTYFLLNVLGAGLACYASYLIHYWPFVVLEGTWFLVSLIGFFKSTKPAQ